MKLKEVEIETHTVCNARCSYCAYPGMAKRVGSKFMAPELFDRIFGELQFARADLERIHLHHVNEPFVHRDIAKLVAKARKAFPEKEVGFSSNAILMTPERSEAVLQAGLNLLYTTIPSSDPDTYCKIMGVRTDVRGVMDNVGRFIDMAGPDVRIVVRSPLGFDAGLLEYFGPYRERIVMEHVPFSSRLGKSATGAKEQSGAEGPLGPPRPCTQTWMLNSLVLLHDGDVPLCCNDQEHTFIIGSVREQSVEALWTSQRYDEVRKWIMGKDRPPDLPCNLCEFGCAQEG